MSLGKTERERIKGLKVSKSRVHDVDSSIGTATWNAVHVFNLYCIQLQIGFEQE